MRTTPITDALSWTHVVKPSESDIEVLSEQFFLHPLIRNELLSLSSRSRVEVHDGYLFLVYHLPIYDTVNRTSRRAEVDLIITENTLVTVAYEDIEPVAAFEQTVGKIPERNLTSTAELVYHFVESVNNFSLRQLRHIEEKVQRVGDALFKEQRGKILLEDISRIKRDLLEFSLTAASQRLMLESLIESGTRFWGDRYKVYLDDLWGDFLKTHYLLENLRATIDSFSETVSQLLAFKTSEVMRRLSALGFLTFPLILYATISLEPTVAATYLERPGDFWLIFGILSGFIVLLTFFFRKRGWF